MEEDVLRQKEAVSGTFDTTSVGTSKTSLQKTIN